MPKLSWKERQNLYEKVRMDAQERREWADLEVPITPESKRRIECFNDILAGIEGESVEDSDTINAHGGIYHLDEINEAAARQNARAETETICVKCGEKTLLVHATIKNKLAYCAYCAVVCFGNRDEGWPPKIAKGESVRRLHRV